MNPMQMKTKEERHAIAMKSHATRRARKEAEERMRAEARARVVGLKDEIAELECERDALQIEKNVNPFLGKIAGQSLLSERAIVKGAIDWEKACGIYFLVKNGCVVYVGQSVDIFVRISTQAKDKDFDAFAFVLCDPRHLDVIESLYIHTLRPPLNGEMPSGEKMAPLTMAEILRAQITAKRSRR